jgi:hypothetical protein
LYPAPVGAKIEPTASAESWRATLTAAVVAAVPVTMVTMTVGRW